MLKLLVHHVTSRLKRLIVPVSLSFRFCSVAHTGLREFAFRFSSYSVTSIFSACLDVLVTNVCISSVALY